MSNNLSYQNIKDKISPCGISCEKCFANKNGKIKQHSDELKKYLGNFDVYAERFVSLLSEPQFKQYPAFKNMLQYFTDVECEGCRKTKCHLYTNCKVRDCYLEKGVDYCFQCDEFPCNKTGFDKHLEQRWIQINNRMKEIGVEQYYTETEGKSRY